MSPDCAHRSRSRSGSGTCRKLPFAEEWPICLPPPFQELIRELAEDTVLKKLLLVIITALCCTLAAAEEELKLPDIGSSAGGILSPEEGKQIGEQMYYQLRGQNAVLDDPLIEEYIESLGYRLVAHSERPEQEFHFFVVRSPEINAFAAPGGYVGMNAGLIATAETESEVAAVLAHEVAHITQNHLVRAYENIRNVSIPIALAMIGALIAASGSGGDAAQAAVVGGSALMQQTAINFTRNNEYEADRIGIHTLSRSGYEPTAMATFFGRMGRALRVNGEGPPEFLRTHPVTTTRISEAKNRAEAMSHDIPVRDDQIDLGASRPLVSTLPAIRIPDGATDDATSKPATDTGTEPTLARTTVTAKQPPPAGTDRSATAFLLFRERARVLGEDDPRPLLAYYRALLDVTPNAAHLQYGLGLALIRARQVPEARQWFEKLVAADPQRSTYILALAEAERLDGRPRNAEKRLGTLLAQLPGNRAVTIAYANQLLDIGGREEARRAIAALRPLLALPGGGNDANLQTSFARACEISGDDIRAGEAHAEVALLNGRFDDALGQLDRLLKRDLDYYQRARIQARIAEITPIALEQRRRERRTGTGADA
jgi:beta-barrel assembly-enhancing protease